jgi:hypothetical protein
MECWECHQPPVFYGISAVFIKILRLSGISSPIADARVAQGIAFLLGSGILVLIAKLLKAFPAKAAAMGLALIALNTKLALLCTMPTNDMAVAFFILLTIYLTLKVSPEHQVSWKTPALLAMVSATAVLTKYNGLAVAPVVAGNYFVGDIKSGEVNAILPGHPKGLSGKQRRPVRVLHLRDDHVRQGPSRRKPRPGRGRNKDEPFG